MARASRKPTQVTARSGKEMASTGSCVGQQGVRSSGQAGSSVRATTAAANSRPESPRTLLSLRGGAGMPRRRNAPRPRSGLQRERSRDRSPSKRKLARSGQPRLPGCFAARFARASRDRFGSLRILESPCPQTNVAGASATLRISCDAMPTVMDRPCKIKLEIQHWRAFAGSPMAPQPPRAATVKVLRRRLVARDALRSRGPRTPTCARAGHGCEPRSPRARAAA